MVQEWGACDDGSIWATHDPMQGQPMGAQVGSLIRHFVEMGAQLMMNEYAKHDHFYERVLARLVPPMLVSQYQHESSEETVFLGINSDKQIRMALAVFLWARDHGRTEAIDKRLRVIYPNENIINWNLDTSEIEEVLLARAIVPAVPSLAQQQPTHSLNGRSLSARQRNIYGLEKGRQMHMRWYL
ncbi:hypothetical protein OIV83_005086 [Microbotryomycetes sp. JL201]|nr:hypothetical protein OIV83_005086 [Microbotryomycetes sp. JL201]